MNSVYEALILYLFGGIAYGCIEIMFRGYTHYTMVAVGGLIFVILYYYFNYIGKDKLLLKCISGCIIITSVEYSAGFIFNILLGMEIWDYSGKPLNLYGQICPHFSLAWLLISIPVSFVVDYFHLFFKTHKTRVRK